MIKVLITDNIAEEAIEILKREKNLQVNERTNLSKDEIVECIKDYHALIVRSKTQVTKDIIEAGLKLKVIGRAGVGVDNIDVETATKRGIIVTNTPDANTISTAELTMAMMLALSRHIYQATASLKNNKWMKEKFTGVELYGKTLGIIGLGRIGIQVAKRALSFGMRILAYDPFVSLERARKIEVELVGLNELLKRADFITLHATLNDETKHMLGEKEFKLMKDGVRIINCARGGLINEMVLYKYLKVGKVAGCALDVFEKEPPDNNPLIGLDNVIATPHIGASTDEAKSNVSIQIVKQVLGILKGGVIENAVNFPQIEPAVMEEIKPYINLAEKLGKFQSQLVSEPIQTVKISYSGEIVNYQFEPITLALLKGLMEVMSPDRVNYVNASVVAHERGIKVIETKSTEEQDFANLITLEIETASFKKTVAGTLFGKRDPRIVAIDGYHVDAVPSGYLLVCSNHDKPGAIAHISSILSRNKINIAGMTVGRKEKRGKAVTVLNIDSIITSKHLKEIKNSPLIIEVSLIKL